MKYIAISGSNIGTKTRIAMDHLIEQFKQKYPDQEIHLIDLAEKDIVFSDGRPYFDYPDDTGEVLKAIMAADVLFIGAPTFQASIPATLKNIFDLLPVNAFREKTGGFFMTAGSPFHYLVGELQLVPILHYMKASVVPKYVFIEEKDFGRGKIINDDIHFRIERLIEDTYQLAETQATIRKQEEEKYDF